MSNSESTEDNHVTVHLSPFHRCHTCNSIESELRPGTKLKRCTGCAVVMYCSIECQKAAWPKHKLVCKFKTDGITNIGYPNLLAVVEAVKNWADAHLWTLATIANAHVYIAGGADAVLRAGHVFIFKLQAAAGPPSCKDNNPAAAFRCVQVAFAVKSEHSDLISNWDELKAGCEAYARLLRQQGEAPASFAGAIPAAFLVQGTIAVTTYKYDLYRLSIRYVPESRTDERTAAAIRDLVTLCTSNMNRGFVMKAPMTNEEYMPEVGVLVRSKKTWRWHKLAWCWDTSIYRNPETTGLHPRQLFSMFRQVT